MTSAELRIGNLVMDNKTGFFYTVTGIRSNWLYVIRNEDKDRFEIEVENVNGIPLTNEVLKIITLGGGLAMDLHSIYPAETFAPTHNVYLMDGKKKVATVKIVSYLHELQNLHYILLGQELNLKEI